MIRVLVADDHPAMRAGLERVLRAEPGLNAVAVCASGQEALAHASRASADVALLDYQLGDTNGLRLCRLLTALPQPPRSLLYTAYDFPQLELAAVVAGAAGVVGKDATVDELLNALRATARGSGPLVRLSTEQVAQAGAILEVEDLPILGMLVDGTPHDEIAAVLQTSIDSLERRIDAMVDRLVSTTVV